MATGSRKSRFRLSIGIIRFNMSVFEHILQNFLARKHFMRLSTVLTILSLSYPTPATAGEASVLLEKHLYAGSLTDGGAALAALGGDAAAEAKSAQGVLAFVSAVEHLGQSLHRHGLETHPGGVIMQLPILRMPVEPNPSPEPITYEKWRAVLQTLFDDLSAADALLAEGAGADTKGEVKLNLDLMKIRMDLNGDGKAADTESFGAIMQALSRGAAPTSPPDLNFAFDRADLVWLRGYIQFLTASAEFGLAVDFEDSFNKTAHAYFPRAGLPMSQELLAPAMVSGFVDNSVGDAIAMVHLLNWKVTDPARLKDVRIRLMTLASLSRESWAAARAETDDDKEWVPNAKQTGRWGMDVDDATIDGWLAVMGEFEQVLDGKKMMPHWRFNKGFNVKRLFEESKRIDAVLIVAGVDAIPFLESGPISTTADWNALTSTFRGNFLGYALWFN
jgi:hypothetical protein